VLIIKIKVIIAIASALLGAVGGANMKMMRDSLLSNSVMMLLVYGLS
jgi:hypothetical protein